MISIEENSSNANNQSKKNLILSLNDYHDSVPTSKDADSKQKQDKQSRKQAKPINKSILKTDDSSLDKETKQDVQRKSLTSNAHKKISGMAKEPNLNKQKTEQSYQKDSVHKDRMRGQEELDKD